MRHLWCPVQVGVLADAIFHGQHLVTGLLEKTDKDFKTALDNLITTDVWVEAQERARTRRRDAKATREQLTGRILEKEDQQPPLAAALVDAEVDAQMHICHVQA